MNFVCCYSQSIAIRFFSAQFFLLKSLMLCFDFIALNRFLTVQFCNLCGGSVQFISGLCCGLPYKLSLYLTMENVNVV